MQTIELPKLLEAQEDALHERLAKLQAMFTKPRFVTQVGSIIDGQTKFMTHTFSDKRLKTDFLELILLTDVQFGHKCCNVRQFVEFCDWILANDRRFCFFGGDMVDAWRIGSPGAGYDNLFSPENQLYKFCELVAPLRSRVLGFVGGNHERRALAGGLDLGSLIAFALRLPYSAGAQVININFGAHRPFKTYLWHGRGASRTAGAQMNMTLSVVPNDEAQLYLSGHIHNAHAKVAWRATRDHVQKKMRYERYYVVSAASFLEHWGSYNEVFGGTYSGTEMPVALLYEDGQYRVEL